MLVTCDYGSRWVEAFALPDRKAKTSMLVSEVFYRFGLPDVLHSGQGPNYESKVIVSAISLGLKKQGRLLTNLEVNEHVEIMNGVIKQIVSILAERENQNLYLYLPAALFASRTGCQSSMKHSPFEVLFNTKPEVPLSFFSGEAAIPRESLCVEHSPMMVSI